MIITEVAAFRQQVRNQIRAAPVRRETYVTVTLQISLRAEAALFLQSPRRGSGTNAADGSRPNTI